MDDSADFSELISLNLLPMPSFASLCSLFSVPLIATEQPKVIFLDAMGTLFGLRGSVGDVYSAIAFQVGVTVAPERLNAAFLQSFKASHPLAFPGSNPEQIPELELNWWLAIAEATFSQAGVLDQFPDFNAFFAQLYHHFALADPWHVYADVLPALNHWQQQGIELGIISNFDSRLHGVLDSLGLRRFFGSITLSSSAGVAKPDSQIFTTALQKHDCSPQQAWHIGDSLKEDYHGARQAGIEAFLIQRSD